jgi:glutamyl-tRNA reductase
MTRASNWTGPGGGLARIVSIGLTHRTAPVEQREKASLSGSSTRAVLRALGRHPSLRECAALSTCNRTELYAVADSLGRAEEALRRALLEHTRAGAARGPRSRFAVADVFATPAADRSARRCGRSTS